MSKPLRVPDPLHVPDQVWQLINQLLNDTIDQRGNEQLEAWLLGEPARQDFFLGYCHLHAELGFSQATDRAIEALRERMKLSAISSQPSASSNAHPAPRSRSLMRWASRHPKVPSIAVAVAVMVAVVLAAAITPVGRWIAGGGGEGKNELKPTAKVEYVAILNHRYNAVWLEGTRPPLGDPRLKVGSRLALASGLIEIKYNTGARVVLEGPAEFYVGKKDEGGRMKAENAEGHPSSFILHPSNAGYLKRGKLVARVEGKDAKGFAIDIPNARVEDLGTEFGIEVQVSGLAEVVVLTGEVDLVRNRQDGSEQRVRLVQDQGAVVAADNGAITMRKKVDANLIAAYRRRLDTIAAGAAAISGYGAAIANPSFETPRLVGMTYANGAMDGWTATGLNVGRAITESSFSSVDAGEVGAHGRQYAFVQGGGTLTSHASTRVIDGANYVLTVALGNRMTLDPDRYVIRLLVDGQEVAASDAIDGTTIEKGRFRDFSIQYVGDTTHGSTLTVQLEHRARDEERPWQGAFDKVRLVVMLPATKATKEDRP